MATAIKDKSDLPDYAKSTADRIENLGFKWEFEYKYPITENPDTVQRLQIRKDQQAPPAEVARYAAAMKRGDQFPPGVVAQGRPVCRLQLPRQGRLQAWLARLPGVHPQRPVRRRVRQRARAAVPARRILQHHGRQAPGPQGSRGHHPEGGR